MTENLVKANGIEICYQASGDPEHAPLLLVAGLGGQLVDWDPDLIDAFVNEQFYVIRYDHRDTGLSTKFDGATDPAAAFAGDGSAAQYTAYDMAADAVGLLDALGIPQADVLGASMGGMIVQTMLIKHADRVKSACIVMSTTGDPTVGQPTPEALQALIGGQPTTREEVLEGFVAMSKIISGGGFPFDEDALVRQATRSHDRMFYPEGPGRHLAAMAAAGDRTELLRSVTVPTHVIHGAADPLITVTGGEAVAAAIPGATLDVIPGMGHEFPAGAWSRIVSGFVENTRRSH